MTKLQFEKLIQKVTGRALEIRLTPDKTMGDDVEIPLGTKVGIYRYGTKSRCYDFTWTTPKKEDSLLRGFITSFCSKYREPDPARYGSRWIEYAEEWDNPLTRNDSSAWGHHAWDMLSPEKLREQVHANFSNLTALEGRLGFYATHYGIGLFTGFSGAWVETALTDMKNHLTAVGIPFRNEMSEKGWVTRFVIGLEKPQHAAILGKF